MEIEWRGKLIFIIDLVLRCLWIVAPLIRSNVDMVKRQKEQLVLTQIVHLDVPVWQKLSVSSN